jgi:hypothetical protein
MSVKILALIVSVTFAAIGWGASLDHPELSGTWNLNPSLSEIHTHVPTQLTWEIEQKDGTIHLVERSQEMKNPTEIRCATDGHDCQVKEEGRPATVSFYYNGPVLVELETEGQNKDTITKKRMHVSSDGNTLTVDVNHILPADKPQEKLVLTKQPSTH